MVFGRVRLPQHGLHSSVLPLSLPLVLKGLNVLKFRNISRLRPLLFQFEQSCPEIGHLKMSTCDRVVGLVLLLLAEINALIVLGIYFAFITTVIFH